MKMNENKVYSEMLDDIFLDYTGKYDSLLRYIPQLFHLLQRLYHAEDITWESKFKINACFSYLAIPDDLIPDTMGPEGFIDDLFICAYVLYELSFDHSNLIQEKWNGDDNVLDIVEEVIEATEKILGDKCTDILGFTGLLKFDVLSSDFDLLKMPANIDEKIDIIDNDIQELTDLLRTILIYNGNVRISHTQKSLNNAFDDMEWEQVQHVIERVEAHQSKFDNAHELELDRIRQNIIIGIDPEALDD